MELGSFSNSNWTGEQKARNTMRHVLLKRGDVGAANAVHSYIGTYIEYR